MVVEVQFVNVYWIALSYDFLYCDIGNLFVQTPQSPIVRTATYSKYCMDEFPNGTNAIVAVLAYTG